MINFRLRPPNISSRPCRKVREWETYSRHHISFPSHISLCYPISLHFSFQNCAFYYVSKRIPLFFLNLKIVLKVKRYPLWLHYTRCRISFLQHIHFLQPNTNTHNFFFFFFNFKSSLIFYKRKDKKQKKNKNKTKQQDKNQSLKN